jgi:outer membrane protein assembly factor BamE
MQKILGPVLLTLLTCCAEFPGVYRIDIEQGNRSTHEIVDQLRPGMTKRQVRFIMGSPLIQDSFNQERWDYIYSMQPGGEEREQQRLTIIFDKEDRLVSFAGDFTPDTGEPDVQDL